MDLVGDLKRRRVVRALIGYGVAAFAVLQIIEPIMHGLHWPDAVLSWVVVALAAGFPVVLTVAWIFDVPAEQRASPKTAALLAGVGLLVAAPGVVWYLLLRRPAAAPAAAQAPSIAVLPFLNFSSDKEQDYFSDGLTEELLDLLAKVPGLHVAARTSAFAFKGKSEDIGSIARKLHVASVLEGSVRKAGDRVRITAQLINAGDGYHVWSETYDRKLTDVFAVQDEIAQAVVSTLRLKLLPPSTGRTANPQAHVEYLLGKQFGRNRDERGIAAYKRALALDPRYAAAWAGLAEIEYFLADRAATAREVAEGHRRAMEDADKAIATAPDAAEGYEVRGFLRAQIRWDWDGARQDIERALLLEPQDADTMQAHARVVLIPGGRFRDAAAELRKAVELDPLNAGGWSLLGLALMLDGQSEAAHAAYARAMEIDPEHGFNLALTDAFEHRPEEALRAVKGVTLTIFRLEVTAMAERQLGHAAQSQQALDELIAKWSSSGAYNIARVYAERGDRDRAFEWLGRAVDQRDGGLSMVRADPFFTALRSDPRWPALLARVNLEP